METPNPKGRRDSSDRANGVEGRTRHRGSGKNFGAFGPSIGRGDRRRRRRRRNG